jgi:AcrR family transcriptional regulator
MARPPDPAHRARTLAAVTDYVLAHGLAGLSLRPTAAALGTSTRMLLYDFQSKEELIMAVLAEARRRESALLAEYASGSDHSRTELISTIWQWASAPEQSNFMRLFFEVYVQALVDSDRYGDRAQAMVTDWLGQLHGLLASRSPNADPAEATLLIAVLRGLLLDQLNTRDMTRTNRALQRFVDLLNSAQP